MNNFLNESTDNFSQLWFLFPYLKNIEGFVAGGCFKNIFTETKTKDFDVFFESMEDFKNAVDYFSKNKDFNIAYETNKVVAFKEKQSDYIFELNRFVFGKPEAILSMFDFTISKFCLYQCPTDDGLVYKVLYHKSFFEHLFLKRLVIDDKCLYPFSTFERVIKYIKYGYMPCKETKLKLMNAIRNSASTPVVSEAFYEEGID